MASGHAINLPTSVFDSVRAMTATIAAELGETAVGSDHYRALFTIGIFLFLITFLINLTADVMVRGVPQEEESGGVMFEATELNRAQRAQRRSWRRSCFSLVTLHAHPARWRSSSPVLVVEGGPILSFDFLFTEPTNGMTAGGILPALVGHGVARRRGRSIASVPIGVAAGGLPPASTRRTTGSRA